MFLSLADRNPANSLFIDLIKKDYENAEKAITGIERTAKELPRIISIRTNILNYPLDKSNSIIWNLEPGTDTDRQTQLAITTSKKGSGQDAVVQYGINFDELGTNLKIRQC